MSDEVFAEIGRISVVFGYLEDSLAEIIGKIVTVGGRRRELGVIVTAELSFKQRIATIDSLLLFALPKESPCLAEFKRIKPLLSRAEENRNRVLHSVWAKDDNDSCPHAVVRIKPTAKQKKGLQVDFVPVSLDDLRAIANSIAKTYGELCAFETQFHDTHQNIDGDTNGSHR